MHKKLQVVLILGLTTLSSIGCSSFNNKPAQIETKLQAASYLNPNINNQPSPVVVTFYQLKSPSAFNQANFFALYNDPVKVLGNDLLDKREIELRPEQTLELKQNLAPNTAYIGVIAAYRNLEQAHWRQLIQIDPDSKHIRLNVSLETQNLTTKLS